MGHKESNKTKYSTSRYKFLVIVPILPKHMFSKEALNEMVLLSTKLNNKTGEQNIFTILHSKQDKFDEFISPDEGLFERNM